ncbi:hypothetical protein ADUPG1_000381, partial [Aduncisulcus paluster]
SECMFILSTVTLSNDNETPDEAICADAWDLFHPVLDVVKKEFVGDKIVDDDYENERVLLFFANLCCDPSHAVEIYDNIKSLLSDWFEVVKFEEHEWGVIYWSRLISMLSFVPSIVPQISPLFDEAMEWCKQNGGLSVDYARYSNNCK